jgi:hypothetical protein
VARAGDNRRVDSLVTVLTHVGWGRAVLRVAVVFLVATVAFLAAALSFARGGGAWWTTGVLIGVFAVVGLCAAAVAVAGRRWPFVPALLASLVLLIAFPNVFAQWYLRSDGEQTVTTVVGRSCDRTKHGCVYHYRLRRFDGSLISRPFSPPGGADHHVGERVDVVEDPRGLFGPRRAEDVTESDDTDLLVVWWSFGSLVATFVVGTVTRQTRRQTAAGKAGTVEQAGRRS